jgi:hypothetical protein
MKALLRLYEGSIKALARRKDLLRLAIKELVRLYEGSIQALVRR